MEEAIENVRHSSIFLPASSSQNIMAFDCLPKTFNQAVGFMFFSRREQAVRLTAQEMRHDDQVVERYKARGGLQPLHFKDFAIVGDQVLSL